MDTLYYRRSYSFDFPKSFLQQVGYGFPAHTGYYSYNILTIEKKKILSSKEYITTIELRDSYNHLISSNTITDYDINNPHHIWSGVFTLYFQSLVPECIDYLLNEASNYINEDYLLFSHIYFEYYKINNYNIGDSLRNSNILIEIPIEWDLGENPDCATVEKEFKAVNFQYNSNFSLYLKEDSAKIVYGRRNEIAYTFPNPKKLFAAFCLAYVRYYNILKYRDL